MEIIECIRKNEWYIHKSDDSPYNAEKEIALIKESATEFDYAFSVGCQKLYNRTLKYKLLYPSCEYNTAWTYIRSVSGTVISIETDFDEIMKDENLERALGNVRINRINFEIKTLTNGKDCEPCVC